MIFCLQSSGENLRGYSIVKVAMTDFRGGAREYFLRQLLNFALNQYTRNNRAGVNIQ